MMSQNDTGSGSDLSQNETGAAENAGISGTYGPGTELEPDFDTAVSGPDKLLTVNEVAAMLNVGHSTVRNWIRQGKLDHIKLFGHTIRIKPSVLSKLVES